MECNFENCPNFERLGKKFADRISELERENAELKAYKDVNEDFKTAWEELKAENDKLKKELGNNKATYEVALSTYNIECGNLLEENKQLWQTLQEIKEIAEQSNVDCIYRISVIRKILTKAEEE